MNVRSARSAERRRHDAVSGAVLRHLANTESDKTYYEAALEVLWEYGEHTPFDAALDAWHAGDAQAMERALSDENRLEALSQATR